MLDVSVVIPAYNRSEALLETLLSLARVDYPPDRWEVVVVDDGSTDDIERSVRTCSRHGRVPVRYLRQANCGPATARNRGAAAAQGSSLIFVDDDIVVDPDFISKHVDTLATNPGCWVLGRIIHPPELRQTPFGRYRDALFERFAGAHPGDRPSETDGLSTQNVSMPADDLRRLGGFDECFTIASSEDWELGWRARMAGIRVLFHPGIVAVHNDWAVSLDRFCERQRLYSVSDVLLWRKYGEDCLRARLVRESAPVDWGGDPARLILKKGLKRVLATGPARGAVRLACQVLERLGPDGRWSHRAYEAAIAIAIFRGVREGFRRYGPVPSPTGAAIPKVQVRA
jgi:GT2 family glycosyltransferase